VRRLKRRISGVGGNQAQAMSQCQPLSGPPGLPPATPTVSAAWQLSYAPSQKYPWGTAAYQDLNPVWSPDGALVAAYDNGSWGQIRSAGRASPAHQ
jgi:hypothetical protein